MKNKFFKSFISITLVVVFVCSFMTVSFSASAGATEMELLKLAVSHLKEDIDELQQSSVKNEELDAKLETLKQELQAIIYGVESDLNAAIAELEETDSKNIAELQAAIDALNKALAEAKVISEAGDSALDVKIAESQKLLTEKLAELQKALESTKESLESKDKELESRANAIEIKESELESRVDVLESKIAKAEDKATDLYDKESESASIDEGCTSTVAFSAIAIVGVVGIAFVIKKKED